MSSSDTIGPSSRITEILLYLLKHYPYLLPFSGEDRAQETLPEVDSPRATVPASERTVDALLAAIDPSSALQVLEAELARTAARDRQVAEAYERLLSSLAQVDDIEALIGVMWSQLRPAIVSAKSFALVRAGLTDPETLLAALAVSPELQRPLVLQAVASAARTVGDSGSDALERATSEVLGGRVEDNPLAIAAAVVAAVVVVVVIVEVVVPAVEAATHHLSE